MGRVFGPDGNNGNAKYRKDVRIPFNVGWWRKPGGSKMNPTYDEVDLDLVDFINYATARNWITSSGAIPDGDKGDITVSGSGATWTIDASVVENGNLANMPAYTIKGNNTGSVTAPSDLSVSDTQTLLSVDHLITLSGVSESADDLGTFAGTTIPDNQTVKDALQALETAVEANSTLASYTNGDAYITATGAGVTVSKNTTTGVWTVTVPSGVDLKSLNITFANTDTEDGTDHIYLDFDYAGLRSYNISYATLNMPGIRVMPTSGTPSSGSPLTVRGGGNNTNDKSYGLYQSLGGGDGSNLNIKILNASVATSNVLFINFTNI